MNFFVQTYGDFFYLYMKTRNHPVMLVSK